MADTFFEFDSSLPSGLDDNLADDAVGHSLDGEEEEYDALNDETFGEEVFNDDWEQDHEKLAEFTEQSRPHRDSFDNCIENGDGLELEKSLSRLVLDENDDPQPARGIRSTFPTQSVSSSNGLNGSRNPFRLWQSDTRHTIARGFRKKRPMPPHRYRRIITTVPEDDRLGDFTSTSPGHSVWGVHKNDLGLPASSTPILSQTPLPTKTVCTVEELERDLLTFRSLNVSRGMMSPSQSNRIVPPMTPTGSNAYRQLIEHHAKRRDRMNVDPPTGLSMPHEHENHLMNLHNQRPMGGPMMVPKMGGFRPLMNRPDSNMIHPSNLPGGYALRGFPRKPHHGNRPLQDQPVGMPMVLGNNPQFGANGIRPIFNHPLMPMFRPNEVLPQFSGHAGPRVPPHLAPHHLAHHNPLRVPMPGGGPNLPFHKGHNIGNNNNSFHNHHQNHHQNHHYHHRDSFNGAGDHDEYAGLMTTWQKQWLLNIQNLQLNVGPAYIADYYYTVYQQRKLTKEEEIKKAPENRYPFDRRERSDSRRERSDSRRERSDSLKSSNWERPSSVLGPTKVYTPQQFENSLGKLQCGSVTAPRKLIDMEVMSPDVNDGTQSSQKDTKKTKQLLLEIESMYLLLLKLEDALNPMAQTAAAELAANKILKRALAAATRDEERKHDSDGEEEEEPEEDRLEEQSNPEELVQRLSSMLLQGDRLFGVLSIRKGKTLLLRLLPHVPADSPLVTALFNQLICGLPALARRDLGAEPLLPRFIPFFRRWVSACGLPQVLRIATALATAAPPRRALTVALGNKFGSSALSIMMTIAAEHLSSMNEEDSSLWKDFLDALVAVCEAARIPENGSSRPVEALEVTHLLNHLTRVKASDQQVAVLKLALCVRDDAPSRPLTATPPIS